MDDNIDVNQGGNFEAVHCSRIHYARLKCSEQGQPLNKVLLTVERLRGSYNARILQGCHNEDFFLTSFNDGVPFISKKFGNLVRRKKLSNRCWK